MTKADEIKKLQEEIKTLKDKLASAMIALGYARAVDSYVSDEKFVNWRADYYSKLSDQNNADLQKAEAKIGILYQTLEDLLNAADCIRHWHDAMPDNSGMVVSAEHVRKLWEVKAAARAVLDGMQHTKAKGAQE